jgi:FixJ family two-component response regulator
VICDATKAAQVQLSNIAVVDDDAAFRDSLRRLLKSLRYAVTVFSSAPDFLTSPQLATTTCLVADVHMPAMTGVELYERLVARGFAIPTILVTAYPDTRVRDRALRLGVSCYLSKPLDEGSLIDCLRSVVARGHLPPAP